MRNSDHAPGSNNVKLRYGGEAAKQYEIMQEVTSQLPKVLVFVVVTNLSCVTRHSDRCSFQSRQF